MKTGKYVCIYVCERERERESLVYLIEAQSNKSLNAIKDVAHALPLYISRALLMDGTFASLCFHQCKNCITHKIVHALAFLRLLKGGKVLQMNWT